MTEDKKAKILDKVRKLLAKAASTPYEGEAQTFREKADELMAIYAIEAWQVKEGSPERMEPVSRGFDMEWYWSAGPIGEQLWWLLQACAGHARCVVVYYKVGYKQVPVVGMEADLDYMDMLFTDLMIQLVSAIDPKPDPKGDYHNELRRQREAGKSWDAAAKAMLDAGFDPLPDVELFGKKRDKMIRDYRGWCKRTGVEQSYNHYKTYGRNFAAGWVLEVRSRMSEMRKRSQGEAEPTGSMALALRDYRQIVREAAEEMFPKPEQESTSLVRDNRKVDYSARGAGSTEGKKARIASNAAGLKKTKELGS